MVELISYWGNDLMIVNAARVSFGKYKNKLDEKDKKLIEFLKQHKHVSVFRHPQLQFRITCPIFIERQLFKHQVGMSANSISGRYVDFSDSYFNFKDGEWRQQSTNFKQGSSGQVSNNLQHECTKIQNNIINICKNAYQELLSLGVSKEQARIILPLCLNTTFIWTGSLLSFLHLWELRLKEDTQQETREIAAKMLELVKNIDGQPFKHTLESWGY